MEDALLAAHEYARRAPVEIRSSEIRAHLDAGIDAFFTDDPAIRRKALEEC